MNGRTDVWLANASLFNCSPTVLPAFTVVRRQNPSSLVQIHHHPLNPILCLQFHHYYLRKWTCKSVCDILDQRW